MVKKIRVIEPDIENTGDAENMTELAKSMDWKLWEILQIMQRLEKKIAADGLVLDDGE
tara:strand:- start:1180 stop:1353 length:174 start_codon:yes stop_codon:yes gene_type:complete